MGVVIAAIIVAAILTYLGIGSAAAAVIQHRCADPKWGFWDEPYGLLGYVWPAVGLFLVVTWPYRAMNRRIEAAELPQLPEARVIE